MQQRNVAVVGLNVEVTMHEHRGCAPMVPHTPQPSHTSLLLLLRGSGCSLAGPGSGAAWLGWGLAACSSWMAGPGQQLPGGALISEVRFELLFQGRRSRERGERQGLYELVSKQADGSAKELTGDDAVTAEL